MEVFDKSATKATKIKKLKKMKHNFQQPVI